MTIQTFNFEGTPIRDVLINNEPWFVGKDICAILDISDHHQALNSLPEDEKGGYSIPTPKGEQQMICVNEPGLYRLIFKSRKPEAERFKTWVVSEVLPAIRQTGSYGQQHSQPEFGADGTVPVSAYIALLEDKIAYLEAANEAKKPKPKRPTRERIAPEERLEIRRLAAEGLSGAEIARRTGRSDGAISGILQACPPLPKDEGAAQ